MVLLLMTLLPTLLLPMLAFSRLELVMLVIGPGRVEMWMKRVDLSRPF
jgi:hypothetical protein